MSKRNSVSKKVLRQLEGLKPGDLVRVEWFEASTGRSSSGVPIDIPVRSWGVYLGVLGERNKQIILAQNSFRYMNGLYDIDYTAIPVTWTASIVLVQKGHIKENDVRSLLNSFMQGRCKAIYRKTVQWRKVNSG